MSSIIALESKDEIERIAKNLLKKSKAIGKFPTPVDEIIQCANLNIDQNIDLSKIDSNFFSNNFSILKSALSKVVGIAIPKRKVIYLDYSQLPTRQNFIKLHEAGHNVLPWQEGLSEAFEDDKYSLDEYVKEMYEREASYFASTVLFQLDRFTEETKRLPLCINSAMLLGQQFGASYHAALRRYVEYSHKRCALLVLELPDKHNCYSCKIRNYFASGSFKQFFGEIQWGSHCGLEYAFVNDYVSGEKMHQNGYLIPFDGSILSHPFNYHFFTNSYNIFILLLPLGEQIRTRTVVHVTNMDDYARDCN